MSIRSRLAALLGLSALPGLVLLLQARPAAPATPQPPRLVVLVFFDQLRGDYLSRWGGLFGKGGFRRLRAEGAWFQDCHYPYSYTVTGAGHASVAAGCCPETHGIVGNDWYDVSAGKAVNCVASERYSPVPRPPADRGGKAKRPKGASPQNLLVPTLADALKSATGNRARVVSLSLKDRSAVLPGGKRPDACYWADKYGRFVTSTYYRGRPHDWVRDFNAGGFAGRWFGKTWERLRPDLDYDRWSGPDDGRGEGKGYSQGRTFPHPLDGGLRHSRTEYHAALANSPFGNEVLLALALRALEAEKLGTRDTPDLLSVSFSSNDLIGHTWGPDSHEVLDVTLRSDLVVRQLLEALDRQAGKGNYVVALTADHGVCPLPEAARARGLAADRINPVLLGLRATEFLDETFPARGGKAPGRWLEALQGPWVYLNRGLIRARGLKQAEVEKALAGWLARQPGIQAAYTRTPLLAGPPAGDALGQKVRRSFYPGRSGDVALVEKPHHLITALLTGTNHGTPHPYDTHVPLLVYGRGVRPGVRREAITPLAVPVILARALGIRPPAAARAPLPEGLLTAPAGRK